VREGIQSKLHRMPEHAQKKLQETLTKIINEGSGGAYLLHLVEHLFRLAGRAAFSKPASKAGKPGVSAQTPAGTGLAGAKVALSGPRRFFCAHGLHRNWTTYGSR